MQILFETGTAVWKGINNKQSYRHTVFFIGVREEIYNIHNERWIIIWVKFIPQSQERPFPLLSIYRHVLGLCVTYKKWFGFYDWIYWTFMQLVIIFHKSLSSTGYSRLLITLHQSTLTHSYIASGLTSRKTRPLSSNGRLLLSRIFVSII
jgi:hypothetical protein